MMQQVQQGFEKSRLPDLTGELFDCTLCLKVARHPEECTSCGSMYCKACIDDYVKQHQGCPKGCNINADTIKPVGSALLEIYNEMQIKCKNYEICQSKVPMSALEAHEASCSVTGTKCINHEVCKRYVKPNLKDEGVCDLNCLLLTKIRNCNGDAPKTYQEIQKFLKKYATYAQAAKDNSISTGPGSVVDFKWDSEKIGVNIELSNNGKTAFLREAPYMFRTIISDKPFMGGIHYWEIHADKRTENELKIGVATKNDFNFNTAFCDFEYGYAYYGLGQLRHGSNASGTSYGKRFKKEGVLGICLNMNKGTLAFGLDGESWPVAYTSDALKKGPIYPAISLLHCAGLTLVSGKPVPSYFLN